jgi:hypothetical protein
MPEPLRHIPTLVEPLDLRAAGAALCCRFGEPGAEAYRLSVLREVLSSSRGLCRALEEFTQSATAHYRGVHCTADMQAEVGRLTRALLEWSESMVEASGVYRDWQEGGMGRRSGASMLPTLSQPLDDVLPVTGMLADTPIVPTAR